MWLLFNLASPQDDDLSDESDLLGGDGVGAVEEALGASVMVCDSVRSVCGGRGGMCIPWSVCMEI